MIEKHYSISKAAKLCGVSFKTMKRWLKQDLGIVFPRIENGSKLLVTNADVMKILNMRRDVRNVPPVDYTKRRKKTHAV